MMDIPILAYHKISDDKEFGLTTIGLNTFESQIRSLISEGYKPVTFIDILNETPLPKKCVIISFDDGYESVYHNAFPILQKYNAPATIFMVVNYLGKYNEWESFAIQRKFRHLSESQIMELRRYGFEIGSHTLNHYHLPSCSVGVIRTEVVQSKKKIEDITGESVASFCFPYGKYNKNSLKMVEEAGYKFATCNIQLIGKNNEHPFSIPRRAIYATDSIKSFLIKLEHPGNFNFLYFTEWTIQRGALAGIWKKRLINV
jgi:peptidoglycan/xylan/chitin deacetylase (PgdA/CDA1 family)